MPDRGEAWQLTSSGAPGAAGGGVTDGAGGAGAVDGEATTGGLATAGVSLLRDGDESHAATATRAAAIATRFRFSRIRVTVASVRLRPGGLSGRDSIRPGADERPAG